jgi:hypothetical protein
MTAYGINANEPWGYAPGGVITVSWITQLSKWHKLLTFGRTYFLLFHSQSQEKTASFLLTAYHSGIVKYSKVYIGYAPL